MFKPGIQAICLSTVLLGNTALWASEGPDWGDKPMPTDFDWVLLTSGEWLKGDLIALYDEELEFDSDEMGVVTLDWGDVAEVRTHASQSLRLTDGRILEGRLLIDADTITLYQGEDTLSVPRSQMHTLASANTGEWDFWSGKLTLGANLRSGNTQQDDYSMAFRFQRRTSLTRFKNDYTGAYSTVDGSQTENNHRFNSSYDYFFTERTYLRPVDFVYHADRFQNIDYRYTYTAGLGHEFIQTHNLSWEVDAGAGWQETHFESVQADEDDSANTPVLKLGTELDWDITGDIEYSFSYDIQLVDEDSGKYTSHMETGLDFDLVFDLEFTLKYIWDRTEEPTADENGEVPDKDDTRVVVGLSWEF